MTSMPDSSASSSTEIDTAEARDALRERARDAIAKQPARTVTILSSLLAAQDELGYLPAEAIAEVAQRMTASANAVWGIASFYPNFRFTPPNRHRVELCWGPTCHVLGAQHILQGLLPHLGLANEGETEDGVISLKLNTCLGVCAHGPAMSFDEELAGHMSLDKAIRLVERVKADDEELQRAGVVIEEAKRSKAEIAAKAAVRTEERAAKARVAKAAEDAAAALEAKAAAETKAADEAKAEAAEKVRAEAEAAAAALPRAPHTDSVATPEGAPSTDEVVVPPAAEDNSPASADSTDDGLTDDVATEDVEVPAEQRTDAEPSEAPPVVDEEPTVEAKDD